MRSATIGARVLGMLVVAAVAVMTASVPAQDEPKGQDEDFPKPEPTKYHRMLRKDVGVWDAEIKIWMAPGQDPQVSRGVERNRMLGGIWLVSDFEGSFGDASFRGHGRACREE